jgi:hypothetical protein
MWRVDSVLPRMPEMATVVKTENECGSTPQSGTISREVEQGMVDYL